MVRAAAGGPHIRAVAYFGTYEPDYPRNAVLIAGLREHGVEVHEFHAALPPLTAAEMAGARGAARLAAGVTEAHVRLLAQHPGHLDIDAVVVGYPGHFLVPFGRLLAAFRHARLVFDPLVSLLDTFAGDRGLVQAGGAKAAAIRVVDETAFRLPALVRTLRTISAHSVWRASGWPWRRWARCRSRMPTARRAQPGPASRSPFCNTASGARSTAPTWSWEPRSCSGTSRSASC